MVFNSLGFFVFFPIVLFLYRIVPLKIRWVMLLIASYYFYMCWNAKYALLIFTSTIITYISGLLMENVKKSNLVEAQKNFRKKCIVAGSFTINLGILFYFK